MCGILFLFRRSSYKIIIIRCTSQPNASNGALKLKHFYSLVAVTVCRHRCRLPRFVLKHTHTHLTLYRYIMQFFWFNNCAMRAVLSLLFRMTASCFVISVSIGQTNERQQQQLNCLLKFIYNFHLSIDCRSAAAAVAAIVVVAVSRCVLFSVVVSKQFLVHIIVMWLQITHTFFFGVSHKMQTDKLTPCLSNRCGYDGSASAQHNIFHKVQPRNN